MDTIKICSMMESSWRLRKFSNTSKLQAILSLLEFDNVNGNGIRNRHMEIGGDYNVSRKIRCRYKRATNSNY